MNTKILSVDFSKKGAKLKNATSVTGGVKRGGVGLPLDFTELYKEINPQAVRIADIEAPYGTNRFLDIHCIFPNALADESIPDSYDFSSTDAYILPLCELKCELYVRLGETPDPFPKPRYAYPMCSYKKWARICEHIIMHYNEGWAGGYKLGLKNFEIWSRADESDSWSGTPEDYYEFYRTVANHLHKRFPRLKLGGYGSGGFASLNRVDSTEKQKRYLDFLTGFLKYISNSKTKAPLDFFTWRSDVLGPEELAVHSRYARSYLDEHGQRRAKSVVTELAFLEATQRGRLSAEERFSFFSSLLTVGLKCEADLLFTDTLAEGYGGILSVCANGAAARPAGFYPFMLASRLSRLGSRLDTTGDARGELYSVAASDDNEAGLFIVSRRFSGRVELRFTGLSLPLVDVTRVTADGTVRTKENISLSGSKIAISAEENELFYLHFHKNA